MTVLPYDPLPVSGGDDAFETQSKASRQVAYLGNDCVEGRKITCVIESIEPPTTGSLARPAAAD
ncbi:MAG: hypothetical protein SFX18_01230 [Pirellulales bacterium]|nr:hypothetical protein [Pirellulales bacterium]